MRATAEQQSAIQSVLDGCHVQIQALPGSGKSTLFYELIKQCEDETIIVMTYNRLLNDKTTHHIKQLQATFPRVAQKHIRSYTYHGLASVLGGEICHNDIQLSLTLESLQSGVRRAAFALESFSLLVIDECQDMRPLFFRLVQWVIMHVCTNRRKLRIVLLGDHRQLLYDYYNTDRADSRYLTLGHKLLWPVNRRKWRQHYLTRSFRSTPAVSQLLNALVPDHAMVPRDMDGTTDCRPVTVHVCDLYKDVVTILVRRYLSDPSSIFHTRPRDIMILAPSLNKNSCMRRVVRALARHGVPVQVRRSGDIADMNVSGSAIVPEQEMSRGVQCSTFCSAKGLEAPFVFVLHDRPLLRDLPNSSYVALSRSMLEMVVFQHHVHVGTEELSGFLQAYHQQAPETYHHLLRVVVYRRYPDDDSDADQRPRASTPTRDVRKTCVVSSTIAGMDAMSVHRIADAFQVSCLQRGVVESIQNTERAADETPEDTLGYTGPIPVECSFSRQFVLRGLQTGALVSYDRIVYRAMVNLLELYLSGRLSSSLVCLSDTLFESMPLRKQLYRDTIFRIRAFGTYDGSREALLLYVDPVVTLCLLRDSVAHFDDKIFELRSTGMLVSRAMVDRIYRVLDNVDSWRRTTDQIEMWPSLQQPMWTSSALTPSELADMREECDVPARVVLSWSPMVRVKGRFLIFLLNETVVQSETIATIGTVLCRLRQQSEAIEIILVWNMQDGRTSVVERTPVEVNQASLDPLLLVLKEHAYRKPLQTEEEFLGTNA